MNKKSLLKKKLYNSGILSIFIALFYFVPNFTYATNFPNLFLQIEQKTVTVNMKNVPVKTILLEIQKQSGTSFMFQKDSDSSELLNMSLNVTNKSIREALDTLFASTNFTYTIVGQTVTIQKKAPVAPLNQVRKQLLVSGRVVDSKKNPIAGATIIIKGTANGAISDSEGGFTFQAHLSDVLEISFAGKQPVLYNRLAELSSGLVIVLDDAMVALDDVVITGVYTRKKESFTGSSSTFSAAELKKVGAQNVLQSLRTLDPSFHMMENNMFGSDPNRMPDIEIRGKSSIVGLKEEYGTDPNQPLFILDGFETTLQVIMDLNMSRVESVTLLKDAASTAIYGSKAANGVVVIETKAPLQGKLRLSYKGDFSFTAADLSDYNLMNSREKLQFEDMSKLYTDVNDNPTNQLRLDNLRNQRLKDIESGVDTYWLSEPIRNGFSHKHNLYVDGGEEKIRYGIGFTYGNTQGVMKGSERQNISGNIDLIYRTGKFQFSNKMVLNYISTEDPSVNFSQYAKANPYYRKYNADNQIDKYLFNGDQELGKTNDAELPVANPLYDAGLNNYNSGSTFGFTNNLIAEWFITSDLKARAKFGITKDIVTKDGRLSPLHSSFDNVNEIEKGSYAHNTNKNLNYEGDLSITYGRLLGEKHMVNAVGGFNFSSKNYVMNGYKAIGFTEDQFGAPSFANRYPTSGKPSYSQEDKRAASFYLNAGYSFDNRYLLDANYRSDGASMFGTNNRFRNTWSVGLGWNIHNEKFMENVELFQLLKLRASVGNPGNQNFDAYQAFSTYSFNGWMSNIFGNGILLEQLGNPDLAWQETINYNLGADISMFGNRLNLNVDVYQKNTNPLLAIISTPGSLGIKSLAMNAGEQLTKGVEGTIKVSPIYRPQDGINWNITLNMRSLKSKYNNIGNSFSKLNQDGKESASTVRFYDGGSPTAIWAVPSVGIDPATGKDLFIKKDGSRSYEYSVEDEIVVGNTEPKIEGVIGTNFYYKGFSFGVYLRYRLGGQVYNEALYNKVENIGLADINYNQDKRALYDRWTTPGEKAQFKRISMIQKTDKSSRFVMDENTISGESFNISYEFLNAAWLKNIGLASLTVQGNMNDVFRSSTVRSERGIEYPFARTFSLSLSATF